MSLPIVIKKKVKKCNCCSDVGTARSYDEQQTRPSFKRSLKGYSFKSSGTVLTLKNIQILKH